MREKMFILKNKLNIFFESVFFLLIISILTILNYTFELGMLTYIEIVIIVALMLLCNAKFYYMPSIMIFVLGGGLTSPPNFKSFGFVLFCICAFIFLVILVEKIIKSRKKILSITFSNSFIITTLLLVLVMLLSLFVSVKPLTTLGAIGGFLINLVVMFFTLLTIEKNEVSKLKLADSFVAIFYVIFAMVIIKTFKLLPEHQLKDIMFKKEFFNLGWGHPNHYCTILIISSIFGIYSFISSLKEKGIIDKIIYLFPFVGAICTCVYLSSRGPLIGLLAALVCGFVLLVIKYRKNKKVLISAIITAVIGATCAILLYVFVIHDIFRNKGLNGRQELWSVAWKHFKENWFLGTGYGTQRIFIMAETSQTVYNYHNYFFQISTCGIIGILVFIIYLLNIAWHCINKLEWFSIIFICVFALFIVNGFGDTLFFSNKIMPLFSICLCYLDLKTKENELYDNWSLKLN